MASYRAGYVTVTAGSDQVVGKGTRFLSYVKAGDQLSIGSDTGEIESVDDNGSLTLTANWAGASAVNEKYSIDVYSAISKQTAFDQRLKELQEQIRNLSREPVISESSDSPALALYYATDGFREKLKNPESLGVDSMGGVRFWGADGYEHTVGIGWFDIYNPLVSIFDRDRLLDTQLYEARQALLTLLADSGADVDDILTYDPGFTLPVYPYS